MVYTTDGSNVVRQRRKTVTERFSERAQISKAQHNSVNFRIRCIKFVEVPTNIKLLPSNNSQAYTFDQTRQFVVQTRHWVFLNIFFSKTIRESCLRARTCVRLLAFVNMTTRRVAAALGWTVTFAIGLSIYLSVLFMDVFSVMTSTRNCDIQPSETWEAKYTPETQYVKTWEPFEHFK